MSAQPTVSVIIPSYNYGFVIGDTIESLQRQTLSNWEAIIVDDGSLDDTEVVVQAYLVRDNRIKYIKQPNAGLPAARNTGMRSARGKYIQFLDADDLLGVRKLELHTSYLDDRPNESVVFSDVRYFIHNKPDVLLYSIDGKQKEPGLYQSFSAEEAIKELFKHNIVVSNAPLFRAEVMDEVGFFDEKMTSLEDWDYWFRMALCGHSFCYSPDDQAMALVRIHKISMSWNWNKMTANRKVLQDNVDSYIRKFIKNINEKSRLLEVNESSSVHYLGFAVFMNIKFYDFWWGIKHGVLWAYKHKSYSYFFKNSVHSIKVRLRFNH